MISGSDDGIVVDVVKKGKCPMRANAVPIALRDRLGSEATIGLLEFLESNQQQWSKDVVAASVDKFERRLVEETSRIRVDMHEGFAVMRGEIARQHADLMKWAFLFWVGQGMWTAGIVVAAVQFLKS